MRFFLSSIAVLLLFPLSPPAMADGDKKINEARRKLRLIDDVLPGLTQILSLTQNAGRLTEQQRYILLGQLVRALNPFMDLKRNLPVSSPAKTKAENFPVIKLKQGKILYFRLDSFESENIKTFMDVTQKLLNAKDLPGGIILDLRNCSGFNNKNMNKISRRCKALQQMIIGLTGQGTSGAAELLAQLLPRYPDGVTLGLPTAGRPFDYKAVELESGFILLTPKIPAFIKKLPEKPLKPTIYCSGKKQIKYLELKKNKTPGKDSSLSAALDLLSVVKQIR